MNWLNKLIGRGEPPRPPAMTGAPSPVAPSRRAAESDARLPGFRVTASEQMGARTRDGAARARLRLRDAFTPTQPVADVEMFAGRAALLASVIEAVEDQRLHVVLFGDRGIGKTSLLRVLSKQAAGARYLVHYVSCGEEVTFTEMFRAVADSVPLLYHGGYAPTAAQIERGETLGSLLPPGTVSPRQVSDLFARLTGTRLLIILDEFDRSPPGAFRRQLAELVKMLSDQSARVQLVIAGVAANLTELVEHIPSIRRNIRGLAVPNMTAEEVGELIRNGERVSGLAFDPAAVDAITRLTSGSPYIAALLAQHAGIAATDRGSITVGVADVRDAIGRAVDEIVERISERGRHAVDSARKAGLGDALAMLAHAALRDGGRFSERALAELEPDAEARRATLDRLADAHGLLEPIAGDPEARYRFREEGVPIFLWMGVARERLAAG